MSETQYQEQICLLTTSRNVCVCESDVDNIFKVCAHDACISKTQHWHDLIHQMQLNAFVFTEKQHQPAMLCDGETCCMQTQDSWQTQRAYV